jgi:hypothetical protein
MNPVAVWILFGLGVVFLIAGAGLMIYGAVQKGAHADGAVAPGGLDKILQQISALVESFGKYFGPDLAPRVGFALVVVGLILIFAPFYVPAHT